MKLREAQRQLTRSRLVEAAAASFRTKGYAATTIDDIATGAGATRATFYLHFRTKVDLMDEVMVEIRHESLQLNERLEQVGLAGDRASVRAWLDDAFDFWQRVRPYAAAQEEAAALDAGTRRTRSDSFDAGVTALVRGFVAGSELPLDHARVRALLIYAQLDSMFLRWMRVGWDIDRTEAREVMADMWMAAFPARSCEPLGGVGA
jgi:AcrR family transcriptional regulator